MDGEAVKPTTPEDKHSPIILELDPLEHRMLESWCMMQRERYTNPTFPSDEERASEKAQRWQDIYNAVRSGCCIR